MGAKHSKQSVDISAGATKAEKGPAGEPLENGTITTASTEEKLVTEANGVEETPKINGSTPHVDEKETSEASPLVEDVKEPVIKDEEKTEAVAPEVPETNGDLDTTVDDSAKSPTDETEKKEEKKRKKKKSWSFRSISFSKKDKSKPTIKENSTTDVKTETVPEVVEEEIVKEKAKPIKSESTAEVPKDSEGSPDVVEEKKESISDTTNVTEVPPPLPSSPPPVETPALPTSTDIETSTTVETTTTAENTTVAETTTTVEIITIVEETPTIVETLAPVQPAELDVSQAEPEDEIVGGGEGLAEPPEGLNTSDIEKEVAEVPLVNGNHIEDIKPISSSPDIQTLSTKIESIKLSNADITEVTHEITNDSRDFNGVSNEIAVSNGDGGYADNGCNGNDG